MSASKSTGVVAEGESLIKAWLRAQRNLEVTDRQLDAAKNELNEAAKAVGVWMMPSDVKAGESLSLWVGDAVLSVFLDYHGGYHLSWRNGKQPRDLW